MNYLDVTRKDVDNLPNQFCVGRSKKIEFDDKEFYIQLGDNKFENMSGDLSQNVLHILREDDPENVESIDGGPACFGDSGKFLRFELKL